MSLLTSNDLCLASSSLKCSVKVRVAIEWNFVDFLSKHFNVSNLNETLKEETAVRLLQTLNFLLSVL